MSYKNRTQYQIQTSVQLNLDPLALPTKHASQLLGESLLYTTGLLTFSAAIFTNYLARPNQTKKQVLTSQHYQLDTIQILI